MNNPYLLKKQLQENEEELSNYLRDMNIWQEQMKRKEHSSSNPNEKKKPKTNPPKASVSKISSWDYSAWDKFDVDNACKELDTQNEPKKNENYGSSVNCLSNKLQSKQSEGLYEKNLGNALVQKQKWAEAILRYTRAIEYYDKDPIFYANRALCYLKTKEFKLAIIDCTSSLKLDHTYVKAFQRRSVAYMALEMYNEAKKDIQDVLKIEPNNKQAKLDIEVVNNKIKQGEMQKISDIKCQKTNTTNSLQSKVLSSKLLCKEEDKPIQIVIPHWPQRVDCKQITSIQKPPHLRSKKPFSTPKIKDVQVDQEKLNNIHLLQTTLKEVCENKNKDQPMNKEITPTKKDSVQTVKKHAAIPPVPLTYIQLKQDWAYLQNDPKLLFQYLKQIPGKRIPSIVRNSMDNDLFVDILRILRVEFIKNGCDITDYLIGISELPRLQMLVMFCSSSEVSHIKELLNYVSKSVPENAFKNLKESFGV
ncbi:RNA polymerase II-associated protein 3-like [Myzus persicae]|uniref:RNA polymerase II-associated protein 3-like n=1 Tax=Myzus persicae TaxID=13164 RepID=UPI000B932840|nr:RNA polymerase II-associated protein 3-like [Myzus persicae]XP_022172656.1 RNA polymerase II-associated protein 3-like [Myzus persicae]XP_022172657.1 RNA polymerase II-associated protein 3-like [Myzus persicae]